MPSRPATALPPGACDTHTHVFGPGDRYPMPAPPAYTPPDAPAPVHLAMLDQLGMTNAILVQPAPYADDCSAIVDAVSLSGGRLRGIATAGARASGARLQSHFDAGIRGLRFVETGAARMPGADSFDTLRELAAAMRDIGLHAQIWADCGRIVSSADWLLGLGVPVVIEHMGRFDMAQGPDGDDFRALTRLVADGSVWVKLGVCRTSTQAPGYPDTRPYHDALVAANPEQLLWASDWPYVRLDPAPDPGKLVDLFDEWIGHDRDIRRQIFVDNPARLYGFGD